jgi:hypothetical protein
MTWGDQLLYATNGARLLSGQTPYRDYFEFLPAGTDLTYALLFRCFGISLWIPNLLMNILAATAVLLTTLAAGKVLPRASLALPAILAMGFGLYGGLDASHHWFSTVFALAAMVVLLNGTASRHIAAAGALCGIVASYTQTKGAAVTIGFVIYLVWQSIRQNSPASSRWRRPLLLCASALASFLLINIHYIIKLGIAEWCQWVIIFPLRYYPTMPSQTLSAPIFDFHNHIGMLKWICVPFLYLAVPLTYLAILWLMHRKRQSDPSQPPNQHLGQLLLIAITGLSMFLAVTPSLSIMRASAVSFPSTILLAWLLTRLTGTMKWLKVAIAAVSIACALELAVSIQRMHWNYLDLPAGRTAILERGKYDLYLWMKEHTHPGQTYLGIAPLSLPLWLNCPAPIHAPGPWEYYRPEHIARSITALETNRIPLLVLRPQTGFQNTPGYEPEHIQLFLDYVDKHYRRIKTFSTGDEVWERIPDGSAAQQESTSSQ